MALAEGQLAVAEKHAPAHGQVSGRGQPGGQYAQIPTMRLQKAATPQVVAKVQHRQTPRNSDQAAGVYVPAIRMYTLRGHE